MLFFATTLITGGYYYTTRDSGSIDDIVDALPPGDKTIIVIDKNTDRSKLSEEIGSHRDLKPVEY